jgi:hypothetical protein
MGWQDDPVAGSPSWQQDPVVQQRSALSELGRQGIGLPLRAVANAVAGMPLAAMDAGVAARNVLGNAYNRATGAPATPNYDMPSQMWESALDTVLPKPETPVEKGVQIAGTMLAGSHLPVPTSAETVPANFISPATGKVQALADSLRDAQDAGYVVPPTTTNPSAGNKALETVSGKIATAQGASIKNAAVTNRLASEAVGLSPDVQLTPESLAAVRAEAGQNYQAVRKVGDIGTDGAFERALDAVKSKFTGAQKSFPGTKPSPLLDEIKTLDVQAFDASHAVDKIDELRNAASVAFRQGDNSLGLGYKQLAKALEEQIDRGLQLKATLGIGDVDTSAIASFRDARQLIAKAHTVEDALNPSTGNVSATKLAAMLKRGEPLSGELKAAAEFGAAFPKAAQDIEKIGSAGISHLDTVGTMLTGMLGAGLSHSPLGVVGGAIYPMARAGTRAYLLGPGQSRAIPSVLTQAGSPKLAAALAATTGAYAPYGQ